jgi:hypothetical protein
VSGEMIDGGPVAGWPSGNRATGKLYATLQQATRRCVEPYKGGKWIQSMASLEQLQ